MHIHLCGSTYYMEVVYPYIVRNRAQNSLGAKQSKLALRSRRKVFAQIYEYIHPSTHFSPPYCTRIPRALPGRPCSRTASGRPRSCTTLLMSRSLDRIVCWDLRLNCCCCCGCPRILRLQLKWAAPHFWFLRWSRANNTHSLTRSRIRGGSGSRENFV